MRPAILAMLLLAACQSAPRNDEAAATPTAANDSGPLLRTPTLPPFFRYRQPSAPSDQRPPWLPTLPPNIERYHVPDDGFWDEMAMTR